MKMKPPQAQGPRDHTNDNGNNNNFPSMLTSPSRRRVDRLSTRYKVPRDARTLDE
jgi:hypothetical protein